LINILVLAAGASSPDNDGRGEYPLCILEMDGVPLIQRQIQLSKSLGIQKFIIALRDFDIRKFHLDNIVKLLEPEAIILNISKETNGAACTALLACEHIDNDEELLILNGNELLNEDYLAIISHFTKLKCTAGVVTFSSIHPRYSYVRLDDLGFVIQVAEKNPISRNAIVGFYWFAKGRFFVKAAMEMIRKDASVNGVFYISPALNELVLDGAHIGVYNVENDKYIPIKNEKQILKFELSTEKENHK